MEKKIFDKEKIAVSGKNVANVIGKTKEKVVKVIDQDDNGIFDKKDVAIIADTVGDVTKRAVAATKRNLMKKNVNCN